MWRTALVSNIDFAPTLLDLAGRAKQETGFDGKSFLPVLEGRTKQISIRRYPAYFDPDQLYHVAQDPKEKKNLANSPECAAKLAELKAQLKRYLAELLGGFGEFKP